MAEEQLLNLMRRPMDVEHRQPLLGLFFLKLGDFGLVAGLTASRQFYLALEQNP